MRADRQGSRHRARSHPFGTGPRRDGAAGRDPSSAAAMRRVVAEQIEALGELNAIVRAQPATHDLSDRRPPRRRRRAASGTGAPSRARSRCAPPKPRVRPVRPGCPSRRRRPGTVTVADAPALRRGHRCTAPRLPPLHRRPRRCCAQDGGAGGGWLRDVLRNACAAAPAAAAPAAAAAQQSLTALTDEIARAMDPAALADAWQRYQVGEQNVFSRRIYTLTGQATYRPGRSAASARCRFRQDRGDLHERVRAAAAARRARAPTRWARPAPSSCSRSRPGLHHAGPRQRPLSADRF